MIRGVLRVLAVLLVASVAALVVWAGLQEVPSVRPGGRYMVLAEPGETVLFTVVPETQSVFLVSSALGDPDAQPDARQSFDLGLDVAWAAPDGEIRREERVWERTRVSAWPVRGGSWRAASIVREDKRWATDSRVTTLPVGRLLPAGGELRVTVPEDGRPCLLRAYGSQGRDEVVGDRTEEERDRVASRAGVGELGLLEPDERTEALSRPRRSLAYRMASGRPPELRRLIRAEPPLDLTESPTAGAFLLPGQGVAVHLMGPVDVRLSLPDGLDELVLDSLSDLPEGVDQPPLDPVPAPPLPLAGGAEGARVSLRAPHTTLRIVNRGSRTLGPLLLAIEGTSPDPLAVQTPGVELQRLAPWSDESLTLIGPDRLTVPTVALGPDLPEPLLVDVPLGAPDLRLVVRPIPDGPDPDARVPVRLRFLGTGDALLDQLDLAVPVRLAPLERRASDGGYVGESMPFDLEVPEGAARLEVSSPQGPVHAVVYTQGPPRGEETPILYSGRVLRYRRGARSTWHRRPATNVDALREAGQFRAILGNVRLEVWEPEPTTLVTRRYAILDPRPGRATGLERTWLLPGAYPDGSAWCRMDANRSVTLPWDRQTAALRHGELGAILHTVSRGALGQPWRLELDGRIAASGRLVQRIEPLRLLSVSPTRHQARLVAPAGSVLWLRARDDEEHCLDPHRGVSAWPLAPREELTFDVDTIGPGHRLYLGGFAAAPVTLEVSLTGLAPTLEDPDAGAWTERIRLEPGESLGQRLRDPDVRESALDAVGFQLGATDDNVGLRITQVGGPPMWVRVLTEIDPDDQTEPPPAALLRRRP